MTLAELQKILRAADPAAVLVSPRILERIIREDCHLPNMYWNIPHSRSYVCDRQDLFRQAEQADLELEPDQLLPDTVILLCRPDPEELSNIERSNVLLKFWRRLFHSRIHIALGALDQSGPLTTEGLCQRIGEIGRTEFEEIRTVLFDDRFLPPNADDRTTWIEFAAVYLELRYFAAHLLPNYFPAIRDFGKIEALLNRDVDSAQVFSSTRLRDAPDPILTPDTRSDESQEAYWKLVRSAQAQALADNTVGAAIQRMRASRIAPAALTQPTRNEAEADIALLGKRLAKALSLSEAETADWTRHMILLLDKADQGLRPTEAKVLEDLQRVCLDHEQDVYKLDLVEYITSGGKRPIKRPLPSQRLVRITKHLRNAVQTLGEVRLSDTDRDYLTRLVQAALHKSVEALRARFRPVLVTAMEDVGLRPRNPIERASFDKMVAELLDRITSYGFLTFTELRDTVSRNQLKLDDLLESEDFVRGDALSRLDRRLGSLLDGVYRPGEIYVRLLERGTSLLFGTWWGRPLTTYVLAPLALAWATLHLLGMFLMWLLPKKSTDEDPVFLAVIAKVLHGPLSSEGPAVPHLLLWHLAALLPVAVFAMALIHSRTFRSRCSRALAALGKGLVLLFWHMPLRVVPLSTIRRLAATWVAQLLYWYVLKPGVVCALLWLLIPQVFHPWYAGGAIYFLVAFLLNSRIGRAGGEAVQDALVNLVQMIRAGLIPGLLRLVLQLFKQITEFIEYLLFLVDEWLRFRSGDSRLSLIVRTILGVVWYPFAFLTRFYMVVLVEPMVNPVKLPISILAAKFVYPLLFALGWFDVVHLTSPVISSLSPPLPYWPAWLVVISTFYLLPDAVTFLFWEMRENWSLYRANRGKVLSPVVVGAHGETVRGLLQPGFHSGTIPHLFSYLREAERHATRTRNWQTARAYRHEMDEVARTMRNFVVREMVALLNQSRSWQAGSGSGQQRGGLVHAGPVHLATNRICLELVHSDHPVHPVEIEIEYSKGWLLAGIRVAGWLEHLDSEQLQAFCLSLAGLYKRADVDLVREQVQAGLPGAVPFQLTYEGVQAGTDQDGAPVYYRLRECLNHPDGELALQPLVFARIPIAWEQWVECWEKDQEGKGQPGLPGLGNALVRLPSIAPNCIDLARAAVSADGQPCAVRPHEETSHGEETSQPRPETQSETEGARQEPTPTISLAGLPGRPIQDT